MLFRSRFRSARLGRPASQAHPSPRQRSARPQVEALEDRSLLSVTLLSNDDTPAVGERITWTATADDVGATPVYQFRVAEGDGGYHIVRDFSPYNSFVWAPMQEGDYDIQVIVKDGYTSAESESATVSEDVASLVVGSQAVISPTAHPLVALYSVPPTSASSVFVQFRPAGETAWRNTDSRSTESGASTNVHVAGMLANTTYEMRHVFSDGTGSTIQTFTTGSVPPNVSIPALTVLDPADAETDTNLGMVFHLRVRGTQPLIATDLSGQLMWYSDISQSGFTLTKAGPGLFPGGTFAVIGVDQYTPQTPTPTAPNVFREYDLAGNPLRETNLAQLNAQLAALGHEAIHAFHHDARRLPDGNTILFAYPQRDVDINGTPTSYVGEVILVLDSNFQVKWVWNAFDHLDVNRGPVLGEVTQPGSPEPTGVMPVLPTVDWLHINSVSLSPDNNLILSVRHQDWVVKIDYRNGAGDGHVIWRLGAGGDFALNSSDPNAWFSHQHDAHFINDHTIILFDNGNTRRATDPTANSRGQVWTLDETTMTATPVLNVDLGAYSFRLGSAQRLSNGNYAFMSGSEGPVPTDTSRLIEVTPDGTPAYALHIAAPEYRAYRMRSMYESYDDSLAGDPAKVESIVVNDNSAQRSMVNRLTVTFDGSVILDPGAIELRKQNGSLVNARLGTSLVDGKTVAVLTFDGVEFVGGSLADGKYTLTVRADRVHDRWGRELDGDGDGTAGENARLCFRRLFGDSDGDGDVGRRDRFRAAFQSSVGEPDYLWYFDFDGDGDMDGRDNGQFNRRFGRC